jgi:aspartate-semialdehyde dehydrogenase
MSVSIVLVPVFHTYSVMAYVELRKKAALADFEDALRADPAISVATKGPGIVSAVNATGKDKIFVGPIKQAESIPGGFWVWAVADNLTVGSALNAYEIARILFPPS